MAADAERERGSPAGSVFTGVEALSSEGVGDEILVVLLPSPGCADARSARASAKACGNSLPRFSARRRIPAAALGLKKNLSGTVSRSTSGNDEDTAPTLGDSEVTAVQHSPGEVVKPDVAQRPQNDCEISATGGTEQAGDILKEEPSSRSNKLVGNAGELEEQDGSVVGESSSLASDAESLTGRASTEEINTAGGLIASTVGDLSPVGRLRLRESACQLNARTGVRACEWNS